MGYPPRVRVRVLLKIPVGYPCRTLADGMGMDGDWNDCEGGDGSAKVLS